MLTIEKRHRKGCKYAEYETAKSKCTCPYRAIGILGVKFERKSLKTSDYEHAVRIVRGWELAGTTEPPKSKPAVTIKEARVAFETHQRASGLGPATLKKVRVLLDQIDSYAAKHGILHFKDWDVAHVRAFYATWNDGGISRRKKLERLRSHFRFGVDAGWLATNPASKIKNPANIEPPTMPYEPEQVDAILRAAGAVSVRLQVFVLVLRYSGLRISDAVRLKPDRIQHGRLFLHTQKTGVIVNVGLPPFLVERLTALPLFASGYWFWNRQQDETKLETATGNMRRALRAVFKNAGVEGGHPHRFRDTFAVEFLKLPGATLEQLQQLLGHKSIKITEKHYAPWVQSRQDQLDRVLQQGWENAALESGHDSMEGLPARG